MFNTGDRVRFVKMGPAYQGREGTVTAVDDEPTMARMGRVIYVTPDGEPGARLPFPENSLDSLEPA